MRTRRCGSYVKRQRKRRTPSCARRCGTSTTSTRRSYCANKITEGKRMRRIGLLIAAAWSFALLAGCSSTEVLLAHSVPLERTAADIPEEQLLDVAVVAFDPGVPDGEIDPAY